MKMKRLATQRAHAFSFDNFATENKGSFAKHFSCYCKNESARLLHGLDSCRP